MRITVEGNHALSGVYRPGGNANAAIAMLAAALLTEEPVTLHNMPRTLSTQAMLDLAQWLGVELTWDADDSLQVKAEQINKRHLTPEQTSSSIGLLLFLAPILVRRQHVRLEIDFPLNRIRTHLEAMRDLGIDVITMNGAIECTSQQWQYKDIILSQASVTATALVLMLAATLGSETLIYNAACEPHIQDLCYMLEEMGAHIEGIGSNALRVISPHRLEGTEVTIGPDHIEAASVAAIGALSGGRIQVDGIRYNDMRVITRGFQRLGIQLDVDDNSIFIPKHGQIAVSNREEDVDSSIETAIWPGFPSDLTAIATIIATQARGTALIHEKLFNNRLLFVDRLKTMGAQIVLCDPHRVIVIGPTRLYGTYMDSPDVRAGLGMLAAALVAEGKSTIDNAQAIEHTFTGVLSKLQQIGAKIKVE